MYHVRTGGPSSPAHPARPVAPSRAKRPTSALGFRPVLDFLTSTSGRLPGQARACPPTGLCVYVGAILSLRDDYARPIPRQSGSRTTLHPDRAVLTLKRGRRPLSAGACGTYGGDEHGSRRLGWSTSSSSRACFVTLVYPMRKTVTPGKAARGQATSSGTSAQ